MHLVQYHSSFTRFLGILRSKSFQNCSFSTQHPFLSGTLHTSPSNIFMRFSATWYPRSIRQLLIYFSLEFRFSSTCRYWISSPLMRPLSPQDGSMHRYQDDSSDYSSPSSRKRISMSSSGQTSSSLCSMVSRLLVGRGGSFTVVCIFNSCFSPKTNFPWSKLQPKTRFLAWPAASISTINGSTLVPLLGENLKYAVCEDCRPSAQSSMMSSQLQSVKLAGSLFLSMDPKSCFLAQSYKYIQLQHHTPKTLLPSTRKEKPINTVVFR